MVVIVVSLLVGVVGIGRDPLARQAVGHAGLVAELVVAVGKRDRRLAGPGPEVASVSSSPSLS